MEVTKITKAVLTMFTLFCLYLLIDGEILFPVIGLAYAAFGFISMKEKPEVKIDAKFAAEWNHYRNFVGNK